MISGDGTIRGSSGEEIYYRQWTSTKPRAVILLAHGLAEHSGRYEEFAKFFAESRIATYALDHPGHGKSSGQRCHVDRFDDYTDALAKMLSLTRSVHPDIPFVLLGHSMGGLIAADFLPRHQSEFIAAVLTGPAILAPKQPSGMTLFLNRCIAAIAPKIGVMQLDASGVSRDPQVVTNYENDPLVYRGKVSARLVTELFSTMHTVILNAESIGLPLLILHGGEDRLTSVKGSKLLHEKVGSEDKKIVVYDGLYHEILNEPERQQVMRDILDWLNPRIDRD